MRGKGDFPKRCASHTRGTERPALVVSKFVRRRSNGWIPLQTFLVQAPAELLGQAFSKSLGHRRCYGIPHLSILLKSRNSIWPKEVIAEALEPSAFSHRNHAMVPIMDRTQRAKIA